MKFSYNYKNGKEEIICYSDMNEFDGISYGIMQKEQELFLPAEVGEENGKCVFTYNMIGMENLRAWMNDASGREQYRMKREITENQQKLFQLGIPEEQLMTAERYMYVDERTQHIRFICVPAAAEKRADILPVLPQPQIPSIPPVPTDDSETIIDTTFQEKTMKEEAPLKPQQEPKQSDQFWDVTVTEGDGNTDDTDEITVTLTEGPDDGEDDDTVLLVPQFRIDASLHRDRTGEIFQIDKKVSVIGRSETRADIVVRNNKTLSKVHCIIRVEDREYYLEDDDSLNGTYLEDRKLQPGERAVLRNGCRVRLSDDEFVFHINEA